MNSAVQEAIDELRAAYPAHKLEVQDDDQGGAWVTLHEIDLGDRYQPRTTWLGFRITFQYPHADVYPHFVRSDLQRTGGSGLGDGISGGHVFLGRQALQISRRSSRLNPAVDTATLKLMKVIQWLSTRP